MRRLAAALGIGLTMGAASPVAASDRPAAQLVATCAACHRLDNRPTGIPPIIGLSANQIVAMLNGFKARSQGSHIMHAVSRTLSDDEIVAVAAYLAAFGQEAKDR